MKIAFSTIACPELTLDQAAETAGRLGFHGLELRTFGHDSAELACDPCLTGPAKARDLFEDAGIEPACLATSVRFDAPIWPPILGRVLADVERPVRLTREAVRLAASYECPYVRVFGFELQPGEHRRSGMRRLIERLALAAATARHTGVKLVIENGGSFPTAADLLDIIEAVGSPLVEAAYSPAAAIAGGEDPVQGPRLLGPALALLKLRDFADGRPCVIGDGYAGFEPILRDLADRNYRGWVVIEHDRLWFPHHDDSAHIASGHIDSGHGDTGHGDSDPIEPGHHAPGPEPVLAGSLARVLAWSGRSPTEIERRKFATV